MQETLSAYIMFFLSPSPLRKCIHSRFRGKFQIQTPFFSPNSTATSPLNHMILCRSQKLYFRTSLGLFPASSINYASKTLTIPHSSCSSSRHYISPSLLSSGFHTPPQPNTLLLFNCLNSNSPMPSFMSNMQSIESMCRFCLNSREKSRYSQEYRSTSKDDDYKGHELGTRISFGIPDHVPYICNECQKTNGNCGIGLECVCHPQDCS
ncbi:uncharacterized protein LOC133699390 [Populus nigra]|uniref:uncharacterized protein LOC133699390 n=1 Tax=Populus nigra TaxID=3691 RepID=UPI002B2689C6|nr:uncharacterized protein LOC133699390 [Populus nigra]